MKTGWNTRKKMQRLFVTAKRHKAAQLSSKREMVAWGPANLLPASFMTPGSIQACIGWGAWTKA